MRGQITGRSYSVFVREEDLTKGEIIAVLSLESSIMKVGMGTNMSSDVTNSPPIARTQTHIIPHCCPAVELNRLNRHV